MELRFDDVLDYHIGINILIILLFTSYLIYRALYHISAYCHTRMFLALPPHVDFRTVGLRRAEAPGELPGDRGA